MDGFGEPWEDLPYDDWCPTTDEIVIFEVFL